MQWVWPNPRLPDLFLLSWSLDFFCLVSFPSPNFQFFPVFHLSLAQIMGHCAGFEDEFEASEQ